MHLKKTKELFLKTMDETEKALLSGMIEKFIKEKPQGFKQIDDYVLNEYGNIINLPEILKDDLLKIFENNKNIQTSLYRYESFRMHGMHPEAQAELERLLEFIRELKLKYNIQRPGCENDLVNGVKEIFKFLEPHIKLVGKEQAIKDLQKGVSLLNKNRRKSAVPTKNILKQDGVYGFKTNAALCDVCKNYKPKIVKKYIQKGIENNIIFDTKNNSNINTNELISKICENLEGVCL